MVNIVKLTDYQLLPLECRNSIWDRRNDYDIFLYGENDHLFKECHLDRFIEYNSYLPKNRISGLIQYEEDIDGKLYPAFHGKYDWDYDSVEVYKGKKFAHFTNLHHAATFILTKNQLHQIGKLHNFSNFFGESHYSRKCKVNTDIFQFCKMKKMICISDFEDNLIYHLTNAYVNKTFGYILDDGTITNQSNDLSMMISCYQQLKKLLNMNSEKPISVDKTNSKKKLTPSKSIRTNILLNIKNLLNLS